MWPPPLTQCQCESAGFCQRHQCEKIYEMVLACRLNWAAFNQWENGERPCLDRIRSELAATGAGAQQFIELPPCRHRGEEPVEHVECELCGGRTQQVPIYGCAIFGKCTPRRYGSRTEIMRTMPSCVRCEKYEAVESIPMSTCSKTKSQIRESA